VSPPVATGLTYDDLAASGEDDLRRELIDGELYQSSSPALRHQDAVRAIGAALREHTRDHGGRVLVAPTDVVFAAGTVVIPDVVFLGVSRAATLGPAAGPDADAPVDLTCLAAPGFTLPVGEALAR
jgi:Uma2 family endonuclease